MTAAAAAAAAATETTTTSTPPSTTPSPSTMELLPSKHDRLFLYQELERIVHLKIRSLQYLPDTRPTNWRGRVLRDEYPEASTVGLRGRQIEYLRMELLPTVSASLLLPWSDLVWTTTAMNTSSSTSSTPTANDDDGSSRNCDSTITTGIASSSASTGTNTTTATVSILHDNKDKDKESDNNNNNDDNTAPNDTHGQSSTTGSNVNMDMDTTTRSCTKTTIADPIGCISLLLSNIMFLSKGNYDARIRHVVKTACVALLQEANEHEPFPEPSPARTLYSISKEQHVNNNNSNAEKEEHDEEPEELVLNSSAIILPMTPTQVAKERFETLEKAIATDILQALMAQELQRQQQEQTAASSDKTTSTTTTTTTSNNNKNSRSTKQVLVRSLQISSVTLVVGGLFAVTGGLAAPALAGAISALCVATHTAGALAVAFTSTAAFASMFGVVGGGLTAYKMKRRTDGLSEWRIRKETGDHDTATASTTTTTAEEQEQQSQDQPQPATKVSSSAAAETTATPNTTTIRGLHATVCVSGWLRSKQDFQTPFGVRADDPPSEDRLELLQRYFAVHAPDKIRFAKILLKGNKDKEDELWERLKEKYGCDPNHVVPFVKSPEELFSGETIGVQLPALVASHLNHAKELQEIYESNHMLQQMERMNAEMFAQMNLETLESMQSHNNNTGNSNLTTNANGQGESVMEGENRNSNLTTNAKTQDDNLMKEENRVDTDGANLEPSIPAENHDSATHDSSATVSLERTSNFLEQESSSAAMNTDEAALPVDDPTCESRTENVSRSNQTKETSVDPLADSATFEESGDCESNALA